MMGVVISKLTFSYRYLSTVTIIRPIDEEENSITSPGCIKYFDSYSALMNDSINTDIIGTISYEITCGISARVPRIYVD